MHIVYRKSDLQQITINVYCNVTDEQTDANISSNGMFLCAKNKMYNALKI